MKQEDSNPIITIKRYSNRKLYDTSQSRYITLAELGERVRRGENIAVIDNDTKADLTEMTLTQVLMTQQKQKQKGIRSLVQNQAEILLQRISVPVQQIRAEALRQVEIQVGKFKRHSSDNGADDARTEADSEKVSPSMNLKLEALKASSDEKLIGLLVVQRLEQLEAELIELKRRVEILENKDDDRY